MSGQRLAAAFYLPIGVRPLARGALRKTAEEAGAAELTQPAWSSDDQVLLGSWGGLACECSLHSLRYFEALLLVFREDEFLALQAETTGPSLAEDGAADMIFAFRDACTALKPVSAFITGHAWPDPLWYVQHLEDSVLDGRLSQLLREMLAILFLSRSDVAELGPSPELSSRECLPVEDLGILIFPGFGETRWRDGLTGA